MECTLEQALVFVNVLGYVTQKFLLFSCTGQHIYLFIFAFIITNKHEILIFPFEYSKTLHPFVRGRFFPRRPVVGGRLNNSCISLITPCIVIGLPVPTPAVVTQNGIVTGISDQSWDTAASWDLMEDLHAMIHCETNNDTQFSLK